MPTGSAPEGMYTVTSGTHVNNGCCFGYGNSETTRSSDAAGRWHHTACLGKRMTVAGGTQLIIWTSPCGPNQRWSLP